jgi:hypothetical protein
MNVQIRVMICVILALVAGAEILYNKRVQISDPGGNLVTTSTPQDRLVGEWKCETLSGAALEIRADHTAVQSGPGFAETYGWQIEGDTFTLSRNGENERCKFSFTDSGKLKLAWEMNGSERVLYYSPM